MPSNPASRPSPRRGRTPGPRALELRITLARIDPPIWRRVRVPDAYTLHQLHRVLQMVFGWQDSHLYAFRDGERRFEPPHEFAEDADAAAVRLRDLALGDGARLRYTYDFGDKWVHEIVVERVFEEQRRLPTLLDGARAGPPEDCGGPFGYEELTKALRDARHPEHEQYREWVGDWDSERFDVRTAGNNLMLAAAWGAI